MSARFAPETLPAGWSADVTAWAECLRERGTADATVTGYALHVSWLARDFNHLAPTPWDVSRDLLSGWMDTHEWAVVTRRKVLGSLRSFYAWGVSEGRAPRSPLAGIAAQPPRPTGPGRLPVPPTWAPHVDDWCTWMKASACTAGTIRLRRFWLRQLAETYADPWAVTSNDLATFMSRDDWSPETKRAARSAFRRFYRWAEKAGHVAESPAADLDTVRLPRTVPRPAPDDAVREAVECADDRTRLILALALYAGLRRGEISRVHTTDVGLDTLRVVGKGGHERLIPLHPELAHALTTEIRRRQRGEPASGWPAMPSAPGWLFPTADGKQPLSPGHIGKLIDRVLPDGHTPHSLRHRFATQAYAARNDLRAVQELLGHASPTTTIRYAAVPSDALVSAVAGVFVPKG